MKMLNNSLNGNSIQMILMNVVKLQKEEELQITSGNFVKI